MPLLRKILCLVLPRWSQQFLNKSHIKYFEWFLGGFCWFWWGRLHFQDFRQNKLSPARSSAFFMYTVFLVRSKSYWSNLGFSVEIVVENVVMQEFWCLPLSIILIHLMFSTVFSTANPRFLEYDLIFTKNTVYMKNAEEWAGLNLFWRKSWKLRFLLQIIKNLAKITKNI